MVECGICLEEYPEGHLERHRETCQLLLVFRCSICYADYVSRKGLRKHLDLHEIVHDSKDYYCREIKVECRMYQCAQCNDQRGYSKRAYRLHIRTCQALQKAVASDFRSPLENPVPVNVDRSMPDDGQLKNLRVEQSNAASEGHSDVINQQSRAKSNTDAVNNAIENVTTDKSSQFPCDSCGEIFANKRSRLRHKHVHQCKLPRMRYGSHVRSNAGDMVWPCLVCKLTFNTWRRRQHHMLVFHTESQYKCSFCKKLFYTGADLRRHEKSCSEMRCMVQAICPEETPKHGDSAFGSTEVLSFPNEMKAQTSKQAVLRADNIELALGIKVEKTVLQDQEYYDLNEDSGSSFAIISPIDHGLVENRILKPGVVENAQAHSSILPKANQIKLEIAVEEPTLQEQEYQSSNEDQEKPFVTTLGFHVNSDVEDETVSSDSCDLVEEPDNNAINKESMLPTECSTSDKNPKFSCDSCERVFTYRRNLRQHELAVHTESKHKCSICQKTFVFGTHLRRHEESCSKMRRLGQETPPEETLEHEDSEFGSTENSSLPDEMESQPDKHTVKQSKNVELNLNVKKEYTVSEDQEYIVINEDTESSFATTSPICLKDVESHNASEHDEVKDAKTYYTILLQDDEIKLEIAVHDDPEAEQSRVNLDEDEESDDIDQESLMLPPAYSTRGSHTKYACDSCPKIFASRRTLDHHEHTRHGKPKKSPELPRKRYGPPVRNETGDLVWPCSLCERTFRNARTRQYHMIILHTEPKYKCSFCQRMFHLGTDVRRHEASCSRTRRNLRHFNGGKSKDKPKRIGSAVHNEDGDLVWPCVICKITFKTWRRRQYHTQTHHGNVPKNAPVPKKGYGPPERNEAGELVWPCTICQQTFTNNRRRQYHVLTYHRESKHICPICQKAFPFGEHLRRHEKSCSKMRCNDNKDDVKPYTCSICERTYGSQRSLRSHEHKFHREPRNGPEFPKRRYGGPVHNEAGELVWPCSTCNLMFKNARTRQYHMSTVHTEPKHKCSFCERMFHLGTDHRRHEKSCSIRRRRYKDRRDIKSEDKRPRVPRTRHGSAVRNENGDLVWPCLICKIFFKTWRRRQYHMHTHHGKLKKNPQTKKKGHGPPVRNEAGELVWPCPVCEHTFQSAPRRQYHMVAYHTEPRYKCSFCERMFTIGQKLRRHEKGCSKMQQCEDNKDALESLDRNGVKSECKRSQTPRIKYGSAVRNEAGDLVWPCLVCNITFNTRRRRLYHMHTLHGKVKKKPQPKKKGYGPPVRNEAGELVWPCPICEQTFLSAPRRQYHMQAYHTEPKHKCSSCHKMFSLGQKFRRHEKSCLRKQLEDKKRELESLEAGNEPSVRPEAHDKPHSCATCGRTYGTQRALDSHEHKFHGKPKRNPHFIRKRYADPVRNEAGVLVWPCSSCELTFKNKRIRQYHMSTVHTEPRHKCSFCEKMFHLGTDYRRHEKSCFVKRWRNQDQHGDKSEDQRSQNPRTRYGSPVRDEAGDLAWPCLICKITFKTWRRRQYHMHTLHIKPRQSLRKGYGPPVRNEAGELVWPCPICKLTFLNGSRRQYHVLAYHTEAKYKCSICQKTFPTSAQLRRHEKSCTKVRCEDEKSEVKPYLCPTCGCTYKTQRALWVHEHKRHGKPKKNPQVPQKRYGPPIRNEAGELVWPCPICKQNFRNTRIRQYHMLAYHTESRHECSLCQRKFPTGDHLRRHEKSCTKMQGGSYPCQICERTFETLRALRCHEFKGHGKPTRKLYGPPVRDEAGDLVWPCPMCKETFQNGRRRQYHVLAYHTEPKHKCSICYKMFVVGENLRRHEKSCSKMGCEDTKGETYPCPICRRTYGSQRALRNHERRYGGKCTEKRPQGPRKRLPSPVPDENGDLVWPCSICKITLKTWRRQQYHMVAFHTEPRYTCSNCQKMFHLGTDHRRHERSCSLRCIECGIRFTSRDLMEKHNTDEHQHGDKPKEEHPPVPQIRYGSHVRNEAGDLVWMCLICNIPFQTWRRRQYHMHMLHRKPNKNSNVTKRGYGPPVRDEAGVLVWPCPLCKQPFPNARRRQYHVLAHHKDPKHKCSVCQKTFSTGQQVRRHEKSCSKTQCEDRKRESKSYPCSICGRTYTTTSALRRHEHHFGDRCKEVLQNISKKRYEPPVRNEAGNLVWPCSYCEQTFNNVDRRRYHILLLHTEPRYKCSYCQRMFHISANVRRHEKSCSLRCNECGIRFTTRNLLNRHNIDEHSHDPNSMVMDDTDAGPVEKGIKVDDETSKPMTERMRIRSSSDVDNKFNNEESLSTTCSTSGASSNFACDVCGRTFKYKKNLRQHEYNIHGKPKERHQFTRTGYGPPVRNEADELVWPCPICKLTFSNGRKRQYHMLAYHMESKHKCSYCQKRFVFGLHLRRHERTCSNVRCVDENGELIPPERRRAASNKAYPCSSCGRNFARPSALRTHNRRHGDNCKDKLQRKRYGSPVRDETGELAWPCLICKTNFKTWRRRQYHMVAFHTEPKHRCLFCQKKFHLGADHRRHEASCSMRCHQCGIRFTTRALLNKHNIVEHSHDTKSMTTEDGIKVEDEADNSAINEETLVSSICSISGKIKKFACDICGKRFVHERNLRHHEYVLHGKPKKRPHVQKARYGSAVRNEAGELVWPCPICKETFNNGRRRSYHMLAYHKESKHKCSYCPRRFVFGQHLRRHEKSCSRMPSDDENDEVDSTEDQIAPSMHRDARTKDYPCSFCGRSFTRKVALWNHSIANHTEPSLKCPYCSKLFRFAHKLRRHKKLCKHSPDNESISDENENLDEGIRLEEKSQEDEEDIILEDLDCVDQSEKSVETISLIYPEKTTEHVDSKIASTEISSLPNEMKLQMNEPTESHAENIELNLDIKVEKTELQDEEYEEYVLNEDLGTTLATSTIPDTVTETIVPYETEQEAREEDVDSDENRISTPEKTDDHLTEINGIIQRWISRRKIKRPDPHVEIHITGDHTAHVKCWLCEKRIGMYRSKSRTGLFYWNFSNVSRHISSHDYRQET